MKNNWGSAIFPLTILIILLGLTFWLRYAIQLPDERKDGKNRHDPDYIIEQSKLSKLDVTGRLHYTMTAKDIRHFPDDDSTDLIKPVIVILHTSKPPVTMSSERAHVNENAEQVDLYENVRILRAASPTQEQMLATMNNLTVRPDDDTGFTKDPVLIVQGKSWLKGVGMNVNNKTQVYVLESQAAGQFESKSAKKKR
jgi:lipopolysaccharide export system protein LptC